MENGILPKKRRIEIIARDGGKCTNCGMTQEQHLDKYRRSLTIDHIDGRGRGSESPNHEPSNLTTLCLPCHGRKDRARRTNWGSGWKRKGRVAKRNPLTGRFIKGKEE